jgi:hypothetical protein
VAAQRSSHQGPVAVLYRVGATRALNLPGGLSDRIKRHYQGLGVHE